MNYNWVEPSGRLPAFGQAARVSREQTLLAEPRTALLEPDARSAIRINKSGASSVQLLDPVSERAMKYFSLIVAALITGCGAPKNPVDPGSPPAPAEAATVKIDGVGDLAIAGPYTHKNLSVYVVHRPKKEEGEPEFLTLEQGTKAGVVKVTEQKNAQVQQILVENNSDVPLFIQMGDLVKGGQQDRTIQASVIIPPRTPPTPIPSFCVEQGRWSGGKGFAAQGMRQTAKGQILANLARDQGRVWQEVREYKAKTLEALRSQGGGGGGSRSTSGIEELNREDFQQLISEYESRFAKVLDGIEAPVGFVYAIGAEIGTADIYRHTSLFRILFPKLLKSAAAEAVAEYKKDAAFTPPTAQAVSDFLTAAWDGQKREEKLGLNNRYTILDNAKVSVGQLYNGDSLVHVCVIFKPEGRPARRLTRDPESRQRARPANPGDATETPNEGGNESPNDEEPQRQPDPRPDSPSPQTR